tara:strand:- start:2081 stop:2728 length:648 start_codon:yes stop_codon:yes gene_type:complete
MLDVTYRAIKVLKDLKFLLVEDTRRTSKLLNEYNAFPKMIVYNDINKQKVIPKIIDILKLYNVGIVSDAGTPLISDPGYKLVRECILNKVKVVSIPGPSSLLAAITTSGLPTDKFVFEGFLPKKKGRNTRLEFLKSEYRSIIIYESPERLFKTIGDIFHFLGDRPLVVCRELTKLHEEIWRGKTSEALIFFKEKKIKGELTLIVGKNSIKTNFIN